MDISLCTGVAREILLQKMEAQLQFLVFDKELWACFDGIRNFRYMFANRQLMIFTDHKPLTQALKRPSNPWTARQGHKLTYITEYTGDIQHIAGTNNIDTDTLSRPPQLFSPFSAINIVPSAAEYRIRLQM
jgi:hypothetical protein